LSLKVLSLYCAFDIQNLALCFTSKLLKFLDYKIMLNQQCKTTFNSAFVGKNIIKIKQWNIWWKITVTEYFLHVSVYILKKILLVNCNFYKTNIENIASKTVLNTDDTVVSCALDLWRNLREKLSILHASLANICCRVTSFWHVFGSRRHSYSFLRPTLAGEHFLVHADISHCRCLTRILKFTIKQTV